MTSVSGEVGLRFAASRSTASPFRKVAYCTLDVQKGLADRCPTCSGEQAGVEKAEDLASGRCQSAATAESATARPGAAQGGAWRDFDTADGILNLFVLRRE